MKNFLICLILVFSFVGFGCDENKGSASGSSNGSIMRGLPVKIPTRIDYSYVTPNGVKISSVVPIPDDRQPEVFAEIETGISQQLRATAFHFPGWRNSSKLSDYRIIFINPDRNNLDGSPALLFNGTIQTAGTVLGFGTVGASFSPPAIILPHQAEQNWKYLIYLRESSRNESEHWVEGDNDLSVWRRYTTEDDIHPHRTAPGE